MSKIPTPGPLLWLNLFQLYSHYVSIILLLQSWPDQYLITRLNTTIIKISIMLFGSHVQMFRVICRRKRTLWLIAMRHINYAVTVSPVKFLPIKRKLWKEITTERDSLFSHNNIYFELQWTHYFLKMSMN